MTDPVKKIERMVLLTNNSARVVMVGSDNDINFDVVEEKANLPMELVLNNVFNTDINETIFPRNCRHISTNKTEQLMILEESPQIRNIRIDYAMTSYVERLRMEGKLDDFGFTDFEKKFPTPPYLFQLSFPYIVYFVRYNKIHRSCNVKLFFRLSPITSMKDYLLLPNLSNINNDNTLCLGSLENKIDHTNLTTIAESIIETFWSTSFTTDYMYGIEHYKDYSKLYNVLEWAYYSAVDPMFIYSAEWKKYGLDVQKTIMDMTKDNTINEIKVIDLIESSSRQVKNKRSKTSYHTVDSLAFSTNGSTAAKFITVGDEVPHNDTMMYVKAINFTYDDMSSKIYCVLEDGEENEQKVLMTDEIYEKYEKYLYKDGGITEATIKDKVFKVGDILIFNYMVGGDSMIKINKIRYVSDNSFEIITDKNCYLLTEKNLNYFSVLDYGEVNGTKMTIGNKYLIFGNSRNSVFVFGISTYKGNVSSGNTIKFEFEDDRKNVNFYSYNDLKKNQIQEFNVENFDIITFPFRYLNRIITPPEDGSISYCLKEDSLMIFTKSARTMSYFPKHYNVTEAVNNIFSEREIYIRGNPDIYFQVGDEVVIADWQDPQIMKKIRKITGFELNKTTKIMYIKTIAEVGEKEIKTAYISFKEGNEYNFSSINIGKVRKVIRQIQIENLVISVGDKIVPNISGIPSFMKKDVFEVVGFINDYKDGITRMLCSNCCTLLCDVERLKRFTFIKPNDKKFDKLKLTENFDTTKIKHQVNDLFLNNESSHMVYSLCPSSGMDYIPVAMGPRSYYYRYMTFSGESFELSSERIYDSIGKPRYGFLNERLTQDDISKFRKKEDTGLDLFGNLINHPGFSTFTFSERPINNVISEELLEEEVDEDFDGVHDFTPPRPRRV